MQRPRTPSPISESLHRQLNSYALAASAAGVSLAALGQPAEAKIVYTHAHEVSMCAFHSQGKTFELDLNHDGKYDFRIVNSAFSHYLAGCLLSAFAVDRRNEILGSTVQHGPKYASALSAGVKIGPNSKFRPWRLGRMLVGNYSKYESGTFYATWGQWKNVTNRYLGLKFVIRGKIHYGWARLSVSVPSHSQINAILTGYAYETIPNKPIITGKTHGKDVITLQDPSLGHLAAGASGMKAWRHEEQ
jgi:hypothetical protein